MTDLAPATVTRNLLDGAGFREVQHASFSHFATPTQHPDRVMQEHDLVYMLEGGWVVGQDGASYALQPHDLVLLQAGHHHYGVEPCLSHTKTIYVHISTLPGDRVEASAPGSAAGPGSSTVTLPMVLPCQLHPPIQALMLDIVRAFWSELPGKHLKLSALVQLLLFEAGLAHSSPLRLRDSLVARTLTAIQGEAGRVLSLDELATQSNVSARTLSERFKKATGQTLHQYQIDLKLSMARSAIEHEPFRSFKELATSLGFYDEFHFSKLFKKKYGSPPSRYR